MKSFEIPILLENDFFRRRTYSVRLLSFKFEAAKKASLALATIIKLLM
jgi:hypothetical protein